MPLSRIAAPFAIPFALPFAIPFALLLALSASGLLAVACGSSTQATSTEPSAVGVNGDYTNCRLFTGEEASNAGPIDDAGLTITGDGTSLSAAFSANGAANTVTFQRIAPGAASLTPAPQLFTTGFGCDTNPPGFASATLSATSGSLTFDSNVAFLSLVGPVTAFEDAGAPCALATGQTEGTVSIVCQRAGDAGAPVSAPEDAGATSNGPFSIGSFTCDSLIESDGPTEHVTVEGDETLTLAQNGASLTATLEGSESSAIGTLAFFVTSASSAIPLTSGQTLTASCGSALDLTTPQTLTLASGSLSASGDTVFLAFTGTCDGLDTGGTLRCTRQ